MSENKDLEWALSRNRGKESSCWLGSGHIGLPQGSMFPLAAKHKVENQTKSPITL